MITYDIEISCFDKKKRDKIYQIIKKLLIDKYIECEVIKNNLIFHGEEIFIKKYTTKIDIKKSQPIAYSKDGHDITSAFTGE